MYNLKIPSTNIRQQWDHRWPRRDVVAAVVEPKFEPHKGPSRRACELNQHPNFQYHTTELPILDSASSLLQVSLPCWKYILAPFHNRKCFFIFILLKPSTEQGNFLFCLFISNVVMKDLTILAPLNAPNTDGIDPGLCCHFHHISLLSSSFKSNSCIPCFSICLGFLAAENFHAHMSLLMTLSIFLDEQ